MIPKILPLSCTGNTLTKMAVPVPKIMALPMPCKIREPIRIEEVGAKKAIRDDAVNMKRPMKKTFFMP